MPLNTCIKCRDYFIVFVQLGLKGILPRINLWNFFKKRIVSVKLFWLILLKSQTNTTLISIPVIVWNIHCNDIFPWEIVHITTNRSTTCWSLKIICTYLICLLLLLWHHVNFLKRITCYLIISFKLVIAIYNVRTGK